MGNGSGRWDGLHPVFDEDRVAEIKADEKYAVMRDSGEIDEYRTRLCLDNLEDQISRTYARALDLYKSTDVKGDQRDRVGAALTHLGIAKTHIMYILNPRKEGDPGNEG